MIGKAKSLSYTADPIRRSFAKRKGRTASAVRPSLSMGLYRPVSSSSFATASSVRTKNGRPAFYRAGQKISIIFLGATGNDLFAGQLVALCGFCAPGFAAVERFTFRRQLRSCSAMNAAIHAAAARQRLAGSVDDGIHLHFCGVISADLKRQYPILRPIKAASVSGRAE